MIDDDDDDTGGERPEDEDVFAAAAAADDAAARRHEDRRGLALRPRVSGAALCFRDGSGIQEFAQALGDPRPAVESMASSASLLDEAKRRDPSYRSARDALEKGRGRS